MAEKSNTGSLTPLNLGDIFDRMFPLYGMGFLRLIPVVAAAEILSYVISFAIGLGVTLTSFAGPFALTAGSIFLSLLAVVLSIVINLLMYGTLVHLISSLYLKQEASISAALRRAGDRFFPMLGASLLVALVTAILAVTIIGIPFAIYLGVRWAFSVPAVLLEGAGVTEALTRSSDLMKGNWWRVFGIGLLFGIIFAVIQWAASLPLLFLDLLARNDAIFWYFGAGDMISLVVTILLVPFGAILLTLLYYDVRARSQHTTIETAVGELEP